MATSNQWMEDPALKDIPKVKLQFLQNLFFEGKKLGPKELLPFFLSVASKSKKDNIHFEDNEMQTIVEVLKKYATPEEIKKMNQAMQMMRSQGKMS